jgi:hypothetical protein
MPENCLPAGDEFPFWLEGNPRKIEPPGKASTVQNWILLTFARLAASGHPVRLVHEMPESGAVVALTGNLPENFRAPDRAFLVGVVADGLPHPACQFHILQNAAHARRLARSCFIPHWPQPGLIPRDPSRGDRFENLVFFGDRPNLAPELREDRFCDALKSRLGITLRIVGHGSWHDYSEADCVLGVREFGSRRFLRKPATKLYNAWLAGVPFVGGTDSAYASDGRAGVDYIACGSVEELFRVLGRLRGDSGLRERLVEAGRVSSRAFCTERITGIWSDFILRTLPQLAEAHFAKPRAGRAVGRWTQRMRVACDRLRGAN